MSLGRNEIDDAVIINNNSNQSRTDRNSTSNLPINVDYTSFTEDELEQLERVFRRQQEFEMQHSHK